MGFNIIITLLAGFLLDKIFGDPRWFLHPVMGFGKMILLAGNKFNWGKNRLLKGALVSQLLISLVFIFFYGNITIAFDLSIYSGLAVETVSIFTGLAVTTLIREGNAVFDKLEDYSVNKLIFLLLRAIRSRSRSEFVGEWHSKIIHENQHFINVFFQTI